MNHRILAGATALALGASLASCGLPPITTTEQSLTIKHSNFVPNFANGVPLITGLPGFADKSAPPTTIPLPGEARTVKLNSVALNLKLRNSGPIPLRIKLFLSREAVDPYTTEALGGTEALIELPRGMAEGVEVRKTFAGHDPVVALPVAARARVGSCGIERRAHASNPAANEVLGRPIRWTNRDVGLALREAQERVVQHELEPDGRMGFAERSEMRHQQAVRERVGARDADRAGRPRVEARKLALRALDPLRDAV